MLQNIREKAQGWFAWVIVSLIGITFVIFGTGSIFSPSREGKSLAKVNSDKIYEMTVERAYKRYVNQVPPEQLSLLNPKELRENILDSLIQELVLNQTMDNLGFALKDERVLMTLQSLPIFQETGFTQKAYQNFLSQLGMDHGELLEELQQRLLQNQLQQGVSNSTLLTDWDIDQFLRLRDQKRDVLTYTVQKKPFEKQITPTMDELKAYFDQNADTFFIPERVSIDYILVSTKMLEKDFKPTDKQLLGFYEQHKYLYNEPERVKVSHILIAFDKSNDEQRTQAEQKIANIKNQLSEGTSFESLAKQHSDDLQSKDEGGLLSWIGRNETTPAFEKVAFELSKAGEVSEVVETEYGFHIIKLLEKEVETVKPYEEVKDDVYIQLRDYWTQEQLTAYTDDMVTLAFDYADSLQPIADKTGLPIASTALFTEADGPSVALLNVPALIKPAFSHELKLAKNNSDLIKLDDKNFVVFRVKEFIEKQPKAFEAVVDEIKATLIEQKAIELAQQSAQDLIEQVSTGKKPFEWKTHQNLSRNDSVLDANVMDAVFTTSVKQDGVKVSHVALDSGDVVLFQVKSIKDGDPKTVSQQEREILTRFLEQNSAQMEYYLLVKAWEQHAKIVR